MRVIETFAAQCDSCRHGDGTPVLGPAVAWNDHRPCHAVEVAYQAGWREIDGVTLCPTCAALAIDAHAIDRDAPPLYALALRDEHERMQRLFGPAGRPAS